MDEVTEPRRRVLIVAYYFPPLGGIGSVRVAGFAEHLPSYGWDPTVLAPRDGAFHRDPDLSFPEDRVIRSRAVELSRSGKRMLRTGGDDVRPASVGRLGGALRTAARAIAYYPDAQVGWYPAAVRSGRRAMRVQRYDAIFSSSVPITAHLIARRLHRRTGTPWIAEFRDPWSAGLPGRVARARAARLERSLTAETAGLVMTSPSWATRFSEEWGRPVSVITNGQDGVPPAPPASASDEFAVAYLGSYYPALQDLGGVWAAIRHLTEAGVSAPDRVRFIGEPDPAAWSELRAQGLEALVEVTGFLPHDEAMARLSSASVLLLAGPRDAAGTGRGIIPGKVFEYLATGLPILYVGATECDVADLLREFDGCHICAPNDVQGIAAALRESRGRRHTRDLARFTRRALTGELARLLDATQPRA
jgi:glycosyltransferase involved in cell wall biosynthesis